MQRVVTLTLVTVWLTGIVGNLSGNLANAHPFLDQYLPRNHYEISTKFSDSLKTKHFPSQSDLTYDVEQPSIRDLPFSKGYSDVKNSGLFDDLDNPRTLEEVDNVLNINKQPKLEIVPLSNTDIIDEVLKLLPHFNKRNKGKNEAVPELQIGCEGKELNQLLRHKRSADEDEDPKNSALHLEDLLKTWGIDISDKKATIRPRRGDIEVTESNKSPPRGDVPASLIHSLTENKENLPGISSRKLLWKNEDNEDVKDTERDREIEERIRHELILLKRQIEAEKLMERTKRHHHNHHRRHHLHVEHKILADPELERLTRNTNASDEDAARQDHETRRRQWEEQERRRVDEERRRSDRRRPVNNQETDQTENPLETYEERLRKWQLLKEEHDRKVREREEARKRGQRYRDPNANTFGYPIGNVNPNTNQNAYTPSPYPPNSYTPTPTPSRAYTPSPYPPHSYNVPTVVPLRTTVPTEDATEYDPYRTRQEQGRPNRPQPEYASQNQTQASYEERLREWKKKKEERDRLIRLRDEARRKSEENNQDPNNYQKSPEELDIEKKLQDYINRNTPIVVTDRSRAQTAPVNRERTRPDDQQSNDEDRTRRLEEHRRRWEESQRRHREREREREQGQRRRPEPNRDNESQRTTVEPDESQRTTAIENDDNVPRPSNDDMRTRDLETYRRRPQQQDSSLYQKPEAYGYDENSQQIQDSQRRGPTRGRYSQRREPTEPAPTNYPRYGSTTPLIETATNIYNWGEVDDRRNFEDERRFQEERESDDQSRYAPMRKNEEVVAIPPGSNQGSDNNNRVPVGSMLTVYMRYPHTNANRTSIPINSRIGSGNAIDFMGASPPRREQEMPTFAVPPTTTKSPIVQRPHACVWAIVSCCRETTKFDNVTKCFDAVGCPEGNWDSNRCRKQNIKSANYEIKKFYQSMFDEE